MSQLSRLEDLLAGQPAKPPIERWHPALSGDIDIVIRRDGRWFHEGSLMERDALVRLFASILRREDDGEYYLITPVEKWRIQVEDLPLQAVEFEADGEGRTQRLAVRLNTGDWLALDEQHPLCVDTDAGGEPKPAVAVGRGLEARLSRAAFYRLVEQAETEGRELVVYSNGCRFVLGEH